MKNPFARIYPISREFRRRPGETSESLRQRKQRWVAAMTNNDPWPPSEEEWDIDEKGYVSIKATLFEPPTTSA